MPAELFKGGEGNISRLLSGWIEIASLFLLSVCKCKIVHFWARFPASTGHGPTDDAQFNQSPVTHDLLAKEFQDTSLQRYLPAMFS